MFKVGDTVTRNDVENDNGWFLLMICADEFIYESNDYSLMVSIKGDSGIVKETQERKNNSFSKRVV